MKWATDAADLLTGTVKCLHFHRKDDKDGQLTAAQIYLKLGEVSAESGMISSSDFEIWIKL